MNCNKMIKFIESFEDEESYYIVTKFMPAGDLYEYIRMGQKPLDEEHAKLIIR